MWKFELNIGRCERLMEEKKGKKHCRTSFVFPDAWITDLMRSQIKFKDLSEKLPISQKLRFFIQREPFLTTLYTVNSSSLLVLYKVSLFAYNYLSNYQSVQCLYAMG